MDIKGALQLNKEGQTAKMVEEPLIRTMAKDMAVLKGGAVEKPKIKLETAVPEKQAIIPPADLPIVKPSEKPPVSGVFHHGKKKRTLKPLASDKKPAKKFSFSLGSIAFAYVFEGYLPISAVD